MYVQLSCGTTIHQNVNLCHSYKGFLPTQHLFSFFFPILNFSLGKHHSLSRIYILGYPESLFGFFLKILQSVCVCVCVCVKLFWSCSTLCNPTDYSPLSSSVHGILQMRLLEWVAMLSSRYLPNPGIEPASLTSPALAGCFFTTSTTWEFDQPRVLGGTGELFSPVELERIKKNIETRYLKIIKFYVCSTESVYLINISVGPIFRKDLKKVVKHESSKNRGKFLIFLNRGSLCLDKFHLHASDS